MQRVTYDENELTFLCVCGTLTESDAAQGVCHEQV